MATLVRVLRDQGHLWRIWVPVLALSIVSPVMSLAIPLVEKRFIDDVVLTPSATQSFLRPPILG